MKLYRYIRHVLEKHVVGADCLPQVVPGYETYGTLYRCRSNGHDHYGFLKQKEAKAEEIDATKQEIFKLNCWLERLTDDHS